jgi:hypothetical protein
MITIDNCIVKFNEKDMYKQKSIVATATTNKTLAPKAITSAVVMPAAGPIKLVKAYGVIKKTVLAHTLKKIIKVIKNS